jgi:hypothetical protein
MIHSLTLSSILRAVIAVSVSHENPIYNIDSSNRGAVYVTRSKIELLLEQSSLVGRPFKLLGKRCCTRC